MRAVENSKESAAQTDVWHGSGGPKGAEIGVGLAEDVEAGPGVDVY